MTAGAAYFPKHAASDFSKMKLLPKVGYDHDHPLQPNHNVVIEPTAYEPSGEFTDYQSFITSARIPAAKTYNSQGAWSQNATPKTSKVMDGIMINHNTNARLQQTISVPHKSTVSQPVSSGSVFEKVGGYIKPPRPESASSGIGYRTNMEDDKSSERWNTHLQERSRNRWSRASSSVR
jgi:hypothetical protein